MVLFLESVVVRLKRIWRSDKFLSPALSLFNLDRSTHTSATYLDLSISYQIDFFATKLSLAFLLTSNQIILVPVCKFMFQEHFSSLSPRRVYRLKLVYKLLKDPHRILTFGRNGRNPGAGKENKRCVPSFSLILTVLKVFCLLHNRLQYTTNQFCIKICEAIARQ